MITHCSSKESDSYIGKVHVQGHRLMRSVLGDELLSLCLHCPYCLTVFSVEKKQPNIIPLVFKINVLSSPVVVGTCGCSVPHLPQLNHTLRADLEQVVLVFPPFRTLPPLGEHSLLLSLSLGLTLHLP
jgi:hypothetical protein